MGQASATFRAARATVLTVSDTRTKATDTSGDLIVERLTSAGHQVVRRQIVTDDQAQIHAVIKQALAAKDCEFVVVTGGTGLTTRDVTPEAIAPLITKPIPGFGELFRMLSYADIGTATIQSRAFAALCDHAVVFALPGSTNACRLAMDRIIVPQMDNTQRPCSFRSVVPDVKQG